MIPFLSDTKAPAPSVSGAGAGVETVPGNGTPRPGAEDRRAFARIVAEGETALPDAAPAPQDGSMRLRGGLRALVGPDREVLDAPASFGTIDSVAPRAEGAVEPLDMPPPTASTVPVPVAQVSVEGEGALAPPPSKAEGPAIPETPGSTITTVFPPERGPHVSDVAEPEAEAGAAQTFSSSEAVSSQPAMPLDSDVPSVVAGDTAGGDEAATIRRDAPAPPDAPRPAVDADAAMAGAAISATDATHAAPAAAATIAAPTPIAAADDGTASLTTPITGAASTGAAAMPVDAQLSPPTTVPDETAREAVPVAAPPLRAATATPDAPVSAPRDDAGRGAEQAPPVRLGAERAQAAYTVASADDYVASATPRGDIARHYSATVESVAPPPPQPSAQATQTAALSTGLPPAAAAVAPPPPLPIMAAPRRPQQDRALDVEAALAVRSADAPADGRFAPAPVARPMTAQGTDALQEIVRAAMATRGSSSIELRLDPSELGKLDIELTFIDDRVTVSVRAEREEALDLMRRSSSELERMLREAGVDLGGLDFAQGQAGGRDRDEPGFTALATEQGAGARGGDALAIPASAPLGDGTARVDIRI